MEGLQPQTIESLRILRDKKTPFVVAANKVDRIHGWRTEKGRSFIESWKNQREDVQQYSMKDTGNYSGNSANTASISKGMTRFVISNLISLWFHVQQDGEGSKTC